VPDPPVAETVFPKRIPTSALERGVGAKGDFTLIGCRTLSVYSCVSNGLAYCAFKVNW
jgi:hypothetical protein